MRHLAALTALGLLASTAAYAQNAQQTQPSQSSQDQQDQQDQGAATRGSQAMAPSFVRTIQLRLRAQGEYDGTPNGIWDDATSKAVQDFQQEHNMQPTGQVDGPTIVALLRPGGDMTGTEDEGSSNAPGPTPGATPGNRPMVAIPLMRIYERGYQQGFEQGLKWAQQQEDQQ
jgi:peptidoglycan hydrolase-like protein with peptidoglycan-binding domain